MALQTAWYSLGEMCRQGTMNNIPHKPRVIKKKFIPGPDRHLIPFLPLLPLQVNLNLLLAGQSGQRGLLGFFLLVPRPLGGDRGHFGARLGQHLPLLFKGWLLD